MKRTKAAVLLAVIAAIFALTGCEKAQQDSYTLYDTNGLKIEKQGAETTVYDLEGGAEYAFTTHKTHQKKGAAAEICEARTTADTGTIKLETVHNLIIVTQKSTGKTLYIEGN